jgi:hypothetical protein
MQLHPDHLKYFCKRLPVWNEVFDFECDAHSPGYQVVCTCGNDLLTVYKSEMPGVYVSCRHCRNAIIVYDLRLYTAATYLGDRKDPYAPLAGPCGCSELKVYVSYEYPDPETDESNDPNDITWCIVNCACERHAHNVEIIDDETA